MSEFKGTPGPWFVEDGEYVMDQDRNCVGAFSSFPSGSDKDRANATLCAAAPDLLESLQWAINKIGRHTQRTKTNVDYCDAVDRAHAAINKALGLGTDQ